MGVIEKHKWTKAHYFGFTLLVVILIVSLRKNVPYLVFVLALYVAVVLLVSVIVQANEAELSVEYPTNPFKRNRKVAWGLVDTMYIRSKSSIIDGFHARSYFRVYLQSGDRFEVSYNFSKADVERLKALSEKVGFKLIVNASLKDYVESEEEGK